MADDTNDKALTPVVEPPAKRPRGNPNFYKGQPSANPGGVVTDSRKNVRKALLKLMDSKPGSKMPKPKNRAEEVAQRLWSMAMVEQCSDKQRLLRLKELIDRTDGRSAAAPEDREALAQSGAKVLIIDSAGRPPRVREEE